MHDNEHRVLVFGVFDLFHPGHEFFLNEAIKRGDELIVVVARDAAVQLHKGITPVHDEQARLATVLDFPGVSDAVLSDEVEGRYEVLREWRPDTVVFGHDQQDLAKDILLKIRNGVIPPVRTQCIEAHEADRYSSSRYRV
ncbi:MAG: adenylyltransferase/cytidyltransferase family protein [bacterium]|nr:adenylyltransferase/cytidyltransferase family protein [bacterium]